MVADSGNEAPPLAPHPPLTGYYARSGERERFIRELFDRTAPAYDRINALASFGMGRWYRRRVLRQAGVAVGMQVLDVAVGTGMLAREAVGLVGPRGTVVGIDPSPGMLADARRRLEIPLIQGRGERLPVADASVDVVTMGYAMRHVADLSVAFAEFRRVLRPGGRVLLLEIVRPESRAGFLAARLYLRGLVPAMARLVSRSGDGQLLMRYFWDTIESCVPAPVVLRAMLDAGFEDVRRTRELGVFAAYSGRRPDAVAAPSTGAASSRGAASVRS